MQLKTDYISGYGDTIDLVVIAASWEKDRARELRGVFYLRDLEIMMMNPSWEVSPSTLTTFYIAALGNSSQMKSEVSTDDIVPQLILTFLAWT
jgi:DNA ligase 4